MGTQIAPFQQDSFAAQQCPFGPQNGRPSGGHPVHSSPHESRAARPTGLVAGAARAAAVPARAALEAVVRRAADTVAAVHVGAERPLGHVDDAQVAAGDGDALVGRPLGGRRLRAARARQRGERECRAEEAHHPSPRHGAASRRASSSTVRSVTTPDSREWLDAPPAPSTTQIGRHMTVGTNIPNRRTGDGPPEFAVRVWPRAADIEDAPPRRGEADYARLPDAPKGSRCAPTATWRNPTLAPSPPSAPTANTSASDALDRAIATLSALPAFDGSVRKVLALIEDPSRRRARSPRSSSSTRASPSTCWPPPTRRTARCASPRARRARPSSPSAATSCTACCSTPRPTASSTPRPGTAAARGALRLHAVDVARYARGSRRADGRLPDLAYLAGLVHDLGKLILPMAFDPAAWRRSPRRGAVGRDLVRAGAPAPRRRPRRGRGPAGRAPGASTPTSRRPSPCTTAARPSSPARRRSSRASSSPTRSRAWRPATS